MTSDTSDQELARLARAVFDAQPFTRLLGAELLSTAGGHVEVRLRNRPELQQQHGFVHGTVVRAHTS